MAVANDAAQEGELACWSGTTKRLMAVANDAAQEGELAVHYTGSLEEDAFGRGSQLSLHILYKSLLWGPQVCRCLRTSE